MELLEKWIWEKHRKHINYKQLVDASSIDPERSGIRYSVSKRGDLLIPLTYADDFWGQLIVEGGEDLNALAIEQVLDLVDLYFKLKVYSWTAESRAPGFEENIKSELHEEVIQPAKPAKMFYLKSATPEKLNYIISFLQERLGSSGKLPWDKNLDFEDQSLEFLTIHASDIDSISKMDLMKLAISNRRPSVVFSSTNQLSDWSTWADLSESLKTRLAIIEADLDSMPLTLSETKDCIDLLWFAD